MSTSDNYVKFYNLSNFFELKESQELTQLIANSKLLVLDIYATWCQPCKFIAPKFQELSKSHLDVAFAKINIDQLSSQQSQDYGITALPTFLFFKNGQFVNKVMGANISDIVDKIISYKLNI